MFTREDAVIFAISVAILIAIVAVLYGAWLLP